MEPPTYVINATWDEDAKVWVAVSDDVPGLVAEADDMSQLVNKLKVLIPELLEANGVLPRPDARSSFPIELLTHRRLVRASLDDLDNVELSRVYEAICRLRRPAKDG